MYWYRCSDKECRQRVSFKKPIEQYVRGKKCACGGSLHSTHYDKLRAKKNTCNCDGWEFPHQKGCKWCNDYKGTYSPRDIEERRTRC